MINNPWTISRVMRPASFTGIDTGASQVEWFHRNPLIVRPASFTGTDTGASQVEWFHWNHLTVMRPASFTGTGTGTAVSQVE